MPKEYRKKPQIVEAEQFYPIPSCLQRIQEWGLIGVLETSNKNLPYLKIFTKGEVIIAKEGDYIVRDKLGNIIVLTPDVFYVLYEKV